MGLEDRESMTTDTEIILQEEEEGIGVHQEEGITPGADIEMTGPEIRTWVLEVGIIIAIHPAIIFEEMRTPMSPPEMPRNQNPNPGRKGKISTMHLPRAQKKNAAPTHLQAIRRRRNLTHCPSEITQEIVETGGLNPITLALTVTSDHRNPRSQTILNSMKSTNLVTTKVRCK